MDGLDGWRARTDGWRAREDGRRWATRHTTTPLIDAMATHTSLTMRASVAARPTTWSGKTTTTTRRARGAVHVLGAASKAKKNRDLDRLRDLATAEETLLVAGFNYQGLTVRERVARERENARTRHGWAASDDGRGRRAKTEPRGRTEGRPRARRGEGGVTARGDARERWDIISTIVRVDVGASSRTRAGRGRGAARVDVMGWLRVLGLGTARAGGGRTTTTTNATTTSAMTDDWVFGRAR